MIIRPDRSKKVLCVCQGGNCRSVALSYVLKYGCGYDALACGWEGNAPQTLEMLAKWADRIIVLQKEFVKKVPAKYRKKVSVYDVGPDRWFNSLHPELVGILKAMVEQDPVWAA